MNAHTLGIHSLNFEQYQAARGVSNSMLRILSERSPMHLKCWMEGVREEPTEAQKLGTIVHRCIFEPDTMKGAFYVRPDGMKFTTNEGKEWKKAHEDRPVLTADESDSIAAMVGAVHRHPTASRLLKNAAFEQSIFAEDANGILRKLRPDVLPNGGNILPDLKTCESAAPDDLTKAIGNFGYYRQGAYYLDGCKLVGREFDAFVLIAVEKSPPYAVACYQIEPMAIQLGRTQYQRDLKIYEECLASNRWPGYPERISALSVPQWMQRALEAAL